MPITTERTWRLQIFTDRGAAPLIQFLREKVKTYEDGEAVIASRSTVERRLAAIATQTLPNGGGYIRTYGDLASLIASCGHELAAEDAAREAAALEAERELAEAKSTEPKEG